MLSKKKGDVAQAIAESIAETFSSARFTNLFKDQTLSEAWTVGDALTVWYSLGHLVLVVAAWRAYNDKSTVFQILDHCRPLLLKHWNVSEDVCDKLRTVVNETEAAAFAAFTGCKDGDDLLRFFSRYVSGILGAPVPFSDRSRFEDELMGIKYRGIDPILNATVCNLFVGVCIATKELLEKSSIDWNSPNPNKSQATDAKEPAKIHPNGPGVSPAFKLARVIGAIVVLLLVLFVAFAALAGALTHPFHAVGFVLFVAALFIYGGLVRRGKQ